MSSPAVSIIVPVYNSEKVLSRCVDSVLCQLYQDFELLLINDGSTDSSGAICDEYAKKDNRVKVIHQANGGPSQARNAGLDRVRGDWICFIDSDDWVEPEYIHGFINRPNLDQSLLVIQSFYDVYTSNRGEVIIKKPHRNYTQSEIDVQNTKELIVDCHLLDDGYPFCKLYNAQVIRENRIRFDPKMYFSEDTVFLLSYIPFVKSLYFENVWSYNYTLHEHSLANKYYDYESEFLAYKKNSQVLDFFECAQEAETNHKIVSYAGIFLTRTINSMYRPETKLKKAERLQKLNLLHDEENVERYLVHNDSSASTIIAFTFRRRLFYCMDFILSILFGARYFFEPSWLFWLRTKRWLNVRKLRQLNKIT